MAFSKEDIQEKQDFDPWLKISTTIFGSLLLIIVVVTYVLYLAADIEKFNPSNLESTFLLSIGLVLILLFNFPWSKISIGNIEIERLIKEEEQDYIQEIERLRSIIENLKLDEQKEEIRSDINEIKSLQMNREENEGKLMQFLRKWNTWGFTASRIRIWGGNQKGFEALGNLSLTEIKLMAGKLVGQDKVVSRISKNGNILYQFKK